MITGFILNIIGATARWIYGSIWRVLLNKDKFSYSDYINGIKDSDEYFNQTAHQFNNKVIGIIAIGLLLYIMI